MNINSQMAALCAAFVALFLLIELGRHFCRENGISDLERMMQAIRAGASDRRILHDAGRFFGLDLADGCDVTVLQVCAIDADGTEHVLTRLVLDPTEDE